MHRKTQETRIGQWDPEGLIFKSKEGDITHSDFSQWQRSIETPTRTLPSKAHRNKRISLDNPMGFIRLKAHRASEGVVIPVRFTGKTGIWITFKPMVGFLPFNKCSFYGVVPVSHSFVFQVSGVGVTVKRIQEFKELNICKKCYGFNTNCIKCSN